MLYGVVIGKESYEELKQSAEFNESNIYTLDAEHFVIGSEKNLYHFTQWLDSPLEEHEIKQGYVKGSEIKSVLGKDSKIVVNDLLDVSESSEMIERMVAVLKSTIQPQWWFYELVWGTLDSDLSASVQRRIRINFDE
jgi:hypothetical protein